MSGDRYDRDQEGDNYQRERGARQNNDERSQSRENYDRGRADDEDTRARDRSRANNSASGSDYGRRDYSRGGEERAYVERGGDYRDVDYRRGERAYAREDDREPIRRGASRSHVRCRDIMTRDVTVATRDASLHEVARMMRDEDTGVIPVVERAQNEIHVEQFSGEEQRGRNRSINNGKLVGLITDRDIVIRAVAQGSDARVMRAEEVMTTDVHTARPNDRVIDAIRKMGDKQVRRIPVIDEDGALRGIISMADVALETEEDRELADALEEISSGASFWNKIFG
jgi:CBS domain-containing protein